MSRTDVAAEESQAARVEVSPGSSARGVLARARRLREAGQGPLAAASERRAAARAAYEAARDEIVARQLATMPIARLRETTEGGVRLGAIEGAGFDTVASVLRAAPHRLMQIRGVGQHSAVQVIAAARQFERAMADGLWLRFEVDRRPKEQGELLKALASYEVAENMVAPLRDDLDPLIAALDALERTAKPMSSRIRLVFSRRRHREEAREALSGLNALLDASESSYVLQHITAPMFCVRLCSGGLSGITSSLLDAI